MNRGYKTLNFKNETDMRHLADIESDLQTLKNIKASFNMNYYAPISKPFKHSNNQAHPTEKPHKAQALKEKFRK